LFFFLYENGKEFGGDFRELTTAGGVRVLGSWLE
jgi:hypothetical protein